MNIFNESMNRPFGYVSSILALVLPPIISIAVTLLSERILGTILSIAIFPVVYVLSLFIVIGGMEYVLRAFEGKRKTNNEAAWRVHIRQPKQTVGKPAPKNKLLKKIFQRNFLRVPKKKRRSFIYYPHLLKRTERDADE